MPNQYTPDADTASFLRGRRTVKRVVWPGSRESMVSNVPGAVIRWPTSALTGVRAAAASSAVVVIGAVPTKPSTLIAVHSWSESLVTVPRTTIGPLAGM